MSKGSRGWQGPEEPRRRTEHEQRRGDHGDEQVLDHVGAEEVLLAELVERRPFRDIDDEQAGAEEGDVAALDWMQPARRRPEAVKAE